MAAVNLPSRVLGRKIKKFGTFFVKKVKVFWGILEGEAVAPSVPRLRP